MNQTDPDLVPRIAVRTAIERLAAGGRRTVSVAAVMDLVPPTVHMSSVIVQLRGLAAGTIPPVPGVTVRATSAQGRWELVPRPLGVTPLNGAALAGAAASLARASASITESLAPLAASRGPVTTLRPKWYRRGPLGWFSLYIEPRDIWIGVYVAKDAVYVCPLPMVVIRYARRGR
jgi:hypothetical protein